MTVAPARPGAVPVRTRQRLETRERIYVAAVGVIAASGLAGADVREIVERAGVARGTFYFHFPTKQHVLRELQWREERRIATTLQRSLTDGADLDAILAGVVSQVLASERRLGAQLFRDMLSVNFGRATDPEGHLADSPLFTFVVGAVGSADRAGVLRDGVDPVQVAAIALVGLFGVLAASAHPSRARDELVRTYVEIILRGVRRD